MNIGELCPNHSLVILFFPCFNLKNCCAYHYCFILLGFSTGAEPTDWQNTRRITQP
jgi:hypothetical protein